jgi:hypothetical protein
MSDQPHRMSDLEPKLRRIAGARPARTDTDGNTSADPSIAIGPADFRALLREIEKLRALVRRLYGPGGLEPGSAGAGIGEDCPDVLARALEPEAPG